jgi:hypothetical protein
VDTILSEKEAINAAIVECVNKAASSWGITCLRFEIREQFFTSWQYFCNIISSLGDMKLPTQVQEAMQEQLVAERRKRAAIFKSEGARMANINIAEGMRQARILASEAEKQVQIDRATAAAAVNLTVTEAKAKGLKVLADSLISEVNFIFKMMIQLTLYKMFRKEIELLLLLSLVITSRRLKLWQKQAAPATVEISAMG